MKIAPQTVVTLAYQLYVGDNKDDEEIEIVEVVGEDEPMVFIHSLSGLPEAFEAELVGLEPGDSFDFSIAPEEGYGEFDEEAIVEFPVAMFQIEDGKIPEGLLDPNNVVPFTDDNGSQLAGRVVELQGDVVVVDFNHPLAGQTLHFEGEVLAVREATPSELEHGHVHGEGGVMH